MNKMTFIGWIGLTALACQSNTEGYQIKGNIEGAGNGIAIMTLPFHGKIRSPLLGQHPSLSGQGKTGILWFYRRKQHNHSRWKMG